MLAELEKLEERIVEAARTVRGLRDQNAALGERVVALERERQRLLEERETLAERIALLLDKVDALRLEL